MNGICRLSHSNVAAATVARARRALCRICLELRRAAAVVFVAAAVVDNNNSEQVGTRRVEGGAALGALFYIFWSDS